MFETRENLTTALNLQLTKNNSIGITHLVIKLPFKLVS